MNERKQFKRDMLIGCGCSTIVAFVLAFGLLIGASKIYKNYEMKRFKERIENKR